MSGRRKFGNGLFNGCNGCNGLKEVGRRKREEGRRKRGEGRRNYDIMFSGAVERCSTYFAALLCLY
ncbi:hypothetical protein [Microcoleus sp. D3_18_C4]|uniref:hypothetical protein n=1 Tax=Microcoleus sp. D3_18_C4 TaxID=3055335 RepID=UPI002FD3D9F8